ncbi:NUDIX hydrolase [Flavobacteriaceae bacterium TK19130]|nr:NUDIX hydrolase [Thermobacterium salinum]
MKYTIQNQRTVFHDHYKMLKASVNYDTFDGNTIETERLAFHRGDSVAIVLVERETKSVLLTKQFRYPTTLHEEGWILEIPAGSLEENEAPEQCIIREVEEETGYHISAAEKIMDFYTSPGASSERLHLYYAEVSESDQKSDGGGQEDENEDIELVKLPIADIAGGIPSTIIDAKSIIGLQWLLQKKK